MIVSISGTPGSGKSTLAIMLAQKLGYKRYYVGGMRRKLAKEHGMTLQEFNTLGEREFWTDEIVDNYQKKLGKTEDDFVVEGRTSFLMIPHSLKIFIGVDEHVGARRVHDHLKDASEERNEGENLNSVEAVLASHRNRMKSDTIRYRKYYDTDVYDHAHYDLILDTTHLTINEAFEKLYGYIRKAVKRNNPKTVDRVEKNG